MISERPPGVANGVYQMYRNSGNFAAILFSNILLCNIALAAGAFVILSVNAALPPKGPIGFCLPSML